jgi:hypothetical protein
MGVHEVVGTLGGGVPVGENLDVAGGLGVGVMIVLWILDLLAVCSLSVAVVQDLASPPRTCW